MKAFLSRFQLWLSTTLLGIKPLEDLDAEHPDACPTCGLTDGWHSFSDGGHRA